MDKRHSDTGSIIWCWAHGILMITAWVVLCPAGIYIARFMKSRSDWFKLHWIIFVTAISCAWIGFVCILIYFSGDFGWDTTHNCLGLLILVIAPLQAGGGYLADKRFDSRRRAAPIWPDQVHWAVGRLLFIAAIYNIYLGLNSDHVLFSGTAFLSAVYVLWAAFLVGLFVFADKPELGVHQSRQLTEINFQEPETHD